MQGTNLHITKGSLIAYRLFDIAHEIDLKKALSLLEQKMSGQAKLYQLQKNPMRSITFRQAPIALSGGEELLAVRVSDTEHKSFKANLQVKIWDYGVLSLSYSIKLENGIPWKELVNIGSILDSDSIIDELLTKKRDDIINQISSALIKPKTHEVFEDYTTYLIEELEERITKKSKEESDKPSETTVEINKIKTPKEVVKKAAIAELLLAEPTASLADSTKKSVLSYMSQYTKNDLLIMEWNSALVLDFTKEKEYQDYVDIIEFSLAQLLELKIYDQLLDEKLDELYQAMEQRQHRKITDFYSYLSEESNRLYMDFSEVFEKLDNSIKTTGDVYLSKVLKNADKKFGFEELKRSLSRKIDTLRNISSVNQEKVNSLIDEKHTRTSHRLEWVIIILITIEVIPFLYNSSPRIIDFINKAKEVLFSNL